MFDSLKGLFKKHNKEVDQGVDKAADVVTDKVGEQHADKVDKAAEQVKDAIDKLD